MSAARSETTVFRVTGLPEPATLARVIELFALRSLLPQSVVCVAHDDEVSITVTMAGLGQDAAEVLAERLRQIVIVGSVGLERSAQPTAAAARFSSATSGNARVSPMRITQRSASA
jgi:hypothetical protein